MPIQLHEESDGNIAVFHLTGKLRQSDFTNLASDFEALVARHGKLRVLADMAGFHGWEPAALWSEIKFDIKHRAEIERLAGVGNKSWEHVMLTLAKPFTKAPIRYFDLADADAARAWLRER